MNSSLQQHMLVTKDSYRDLLKSLQLNNRVVIEIGVGTGDLTRLILEQNPAKIIGYEIDSNLRDTIIYPKLDLRIADFLQADLSFVQNKKYCLISNPPYDILEDIAPMVTGINSIFRDVILMVQHFLIIKKMKSLNFL